MFKRRAEWIWMQGTIAEQQHILNQKPRDLNSFRNLYLYFRREFTVKDQFYAEPFFISADGRYQLFINGTLLGRGPARCHPHRQYVDRYDINPLLENGKNVIAVLVHSYGKNMSWYELPAGVQLDVFGCGSLFCQGSVKSGDKPLSLDSGKSWKYRRPLAWQQDVPSGGTGFVEYFDFRKVPRGWNLTGYDDSSWEESQELRLPFPLGGSDLVPFPAMRERDIPYLHEEFVLPRQLVWQKEVKEKPHAIAAEQLKAEQLEDPEACRIERSNHGFEILTDQESAAVLLWDFGEVVAGRVRLELDAPENAVIDVAYGEQLTAGKDLLFPPQIPGISFNPVHRITLSEGFQVFEQFEMAGLRYLRLTFRNCPRKLLVKSIGLVSCHYPQAQQGSFLCSDPVLTKIWKAGVSTVGICSQDGFLDCPTREQRQWTGDVYVESLVSFIAERDKRLVRKYLRQVAETQGADGMVMMATTCDLEAAKKVFIPDFALLWILTAENYLLYSGDLDTIRELFQGMVKLINWFCFYLDEQDLLCDLPGWTFIDWSVELGKQGAVAVLNALFVGALKALCSFARQLGFTTTAEEYEGVAERLKIAINSTFWDERRNAYVDSWQNGKKSRVISQHANAALICFDIAPRKRWAGILSGILDEGRVKLTKSWSRDRERIFNAERDIVMVQPFFSVFLHRALRKAGKIDALLKEIRGKWGPMVEKGATFWELWQLTENSSTCHGFSSGPSYFLSTVLLGIHPLENGFKRFRIEIPLCDITWAKGTMPTPYGKISVEWSRNNNLITLEIVIPKGLKAEAVFPPGFEAEQPRILSWGRHTVRALNRE